MEDMENKAITKACAAIGGQAMMARAIKVSPPTVSQWCNGVRPIPAERCPEIERVTGGAVRCEELRPDVDWAVLRTPCEIAAA